MENIKNKIEKILHYGVKHYLIEEIDVPQIRNELLDLFKLDEPSYNIIPFENSSDLHELLDNLIEYAILNGLIPNNSIINRDLFDTKIMGLLTPRQSEVVRMFNFKRETQSIEAATEYFYSLSKSTNYIRMDRIAKNLTWETEADFGELKITINMSKPELDPKEIAAANLIKSKEYPKCLLCVENVGYVGRRNYPARQNLRVIPLALGGEEWYFQYSPYIYYNEHCILFSKDHKPMNIDNGAFIRMFDFIDQFPHYFLGANAGLPIVGGSVLGHDHYQGGSEIFPIQKAVIDLELFSPQYPNVKIGTIKWFMAAIRLEGNNRNDLIKLAEHVLEQWKTYSDEVVDILSSTETNTGNVPHNAITPIVRKTKENSYIMDLVLRNNRTTDTYPDGIFHPHKALHHIKKENIGVMEVMGVAILPGRLKDELEEIKKILCGHSTHEISEFEKQSTKLNKHLHWIKELIAKHGSSLEDDAAEQVLKEEVGYKFKDVLLTCSVFKNDTKGRQAFRRFLDYSGFSVQCEKNEDV